MYTQSSFIPHCNHYSVLTILFYAALQSLFCTHIPPFCCIAIIILYTQSSFILYCNHYSLHTILLYAALQSLFCTHNPPLCCIAIHSLFCTHKASLNRIVIIILYTQSPFILYCNHYSVLTILLYILL